MTLFRNFFSCVRGNRSHTHRRLSSSQTKIKFGEPLDKVCSKDSHLPMPIFKLITFLAHEGYYSHNLFRRPGNINQMKIIMKLLAQGKTVQWSNYNLYTAANIAKKYLLHLPGGLFGRKGELILLATYDMSDECRTNEFLKLLRQMIPATKELTILLFGILFRMVTHSVNVHHAARTSITTRDPSLQDEFESPTTAVAADLRHPTRSPTEHSIESKHYTSKQSMLAEAVAKSVAGSLFHTCRDSLEKVEIAVTVLQNLILAFPSFDVEFIDFFDQAMNKLSHSTSSTASSHEMSISGSSKIVRKASELAVSLEMWSENFGKNASQRSSLKESLNRHDRLDYEDHRITHVQMQSCYQASIPSIMITSPQGEDDDPRLDRCDEPSGETERARYTQRNQSDGTGFRHHQARIQSMKRRHQENLQKRSDWFLNNTPQPASPVFRFDNNFDSIVVVTCGGSSICLGQSKPLASGNRCILLHSNNPTIISKYLASSGPDILQTTPNNSRPYTPDYSMMSRVPPDMESYGTSLSTSDAQLYDTTETEINPTIASNIDLDMSNTMDPEAPNSVPLIRRLLPSRSSVSSRKASIPSKPCQFEHLESSQIDCDRSTPGLGCADDDDKDEEDEFLIDDDTQSNYY